MLSHIAMLEGAAERRSDPIAHEQNARIRNDQLRANSIVRTKLQEARLAEQELLRLQGASPVDMHMTIDAGLERGRAGAAGKVFEMLSGPRAEL